MPRLKLVIDDETFEALEQRARSERRSTDWQAEVILRQSLGLPFPVPIQANQKEAPAVAIHSPSQMESQDLF
jgi:hypothetical protein